MTTKNNWFEVSKPGLAQLLDGKSRTFAIAELLQNAWAQNVSSVSVKIAKEKGSAYRVEVIDDDPDGWRDIADAFTLFERFEAKLEKHQGQLTRAAIELTKDWRTDRVLRRLEAMLAVADHSASLIITGNGDVLEPEQGIIAIGSGGAYAHSAAKALLSNTDLPAAEIVKKSLEIAGELCIYTNMHHTIETL